MNDDFNLDDLLEDFDEDLNEFIDHNNKENNINIDDLHQEYNDEEYINIEDLFDNEDEDNDINNRDYLKNIEDLYEEDQVEVDHKNNIEDNTDKSKAQLQKEILLNEVKNKKEQNKKRKQKKDKEKIDDVTNKFKTFFKKSKIELRLGDIIFIAFSILILISLIMGSGYKNININKENIKDNSFFKKHEDLTNDDFFIKEDFNNKANNEIKQSSNINLFKSNVNNASDIYSSLITFINQEEEIFEMYFSKNISKDDIIRFLKNQISLKNNLLLKEEANNSPELNNYNLSIQSNIRKNINITKELIHFVEINENKRNIDKFFINTKKQLLKDLEYSNKQLIQDLKSNNIDFELKDNIPYI